MIFYFSRAVEDTEVVEVYGEEERRKRGFRRLRGEEGVSDEEKEEDEDEI